VYFWPVLIIDVVKELFRSKLWVGVSSEVSLPVTIENDFFGVNIAPSDDIECEDYIISRLDELGVRHVRMDFSYCSFDGDAERLLQRVLDANLEVFLNVFPPDTEAKILASDLDAMQRWRDFVKSVFEKYNKSVAVFEIGNTPNRGRWSGFGNRDFLMAWEIACEEVDPYETKLAGPNVSDFEPLYNLLFLSAMARFSRVPNIHTDNLFVERVVEPEEYDHRVLGRLLKSPLSLNLIKKMRVLDKIGQRFGVDASYCTYNCWTVKRLARKSTNPEQKKVDYLLRYLILAAASNSMKRVYWGPLLSNRDGLIDCGGEGYPAIDNVSFYKEIIGRQDDFKIRPAFIAMKKLVDLLSGSICVQGVSADNGINHFVFTKNENDLHILWCRDAQTIPLTSLYPEKILDRKCARDSNRSENPQRSENSGLLEFRDTLGEKIDYRPEVISEQPLFILTHANDIELRLDTGSLKSMNVNNDVMLSQPGQQAVHVELEHWRGALMLDNDASLPEVVTHLLPEAIQLLPVNKILRDTRNRLWTVDEHCVLDEGIFHAGKQGDSDKKQLTIKLNRAKGIKKFTYRFVASKGKRHWDNASYMLRRGIRTPQPVAYFERYNNSGIEENYYICRYIENAFSARDVFRAFNKGEKDFRGFSKEQMFADLAGFICNMHNQRIIHRDLSSGNLMMAMNDANGIDMYMIDIGRAKMGFNERLSARQRFIDLMRICYKLDWADRELFVDQYNKHFGSVVARWWRLPLYFYESKQTFKKSLKRAIKRS
jgi:hypothetical protein